MSANRDREEEIFDAARELAADERAAYLAERCGQDADLRQRIEGMLEADAAAGEFFKTHDAPSPTVIHADASLSPSIEKAGDRIGRYKLLQQIGEGGCGIVYMAEQEEPVRRRVALKVIKLGMDTKQVIARFEAERQALALMDHPNIAKVLDAGATETGRPYFVMELVRGIKITDFCDENKLSTADRLKLFIQVCQAIQHAHQKGVIHRDIKPSNILVTINDGVPVPKVIDFGIAKATAGRLTDQTLFTAFEQFIGTPAYMSPEQAVMTSLDIDTRSDIYSLGVLLYELLTGKTPFDAKELLAAGLDEMRRTIREQEPPRPSTRLSTMAADALTTTANEHHTDAPKLIHLLRGDLDWIAMKCLEKDRSRRYETANGLGMDVQRYLNDDAVQACPPSATYRLKKFARRNKGPVITAALVLLTLMAGIVGTSFGLMRAEQARRAEARRAEGERLARQEAQAREAEAKAVLDFVQQKVFAAARPEGQPGGLGHDVTLRRAIEAALPFVIQSFTDRPLIEARLRSTLGLSFWYLGEAGIAIEQQERARKLFTEHLGSDHPDTLACMRALGNSYQHGGWYADALKLREELVAVSRAKLGPDHPDTIRAMTGLANSYGDLGRQGEALKLREETLALARAKFAPDDSETLGCISNLANSYEQADRHAEALALREQSLALWKAKSGVNHPEMLSAMGNLAFSYHAVGRFADALKLREDVLALCKAEVGPHHRDTLIAMQNLAISYSNFGRHNEALQLEEQTLTLYHAHVGVDHPDTLNVMSNLATSYHTLGRHAEALKLNEELLALRKEKLGLDHPNTLGSINNLANSYAKLGRHAQAVKLYEETLPLFKEKLGPHHRDTLIAMQDLAASYSNVGRDGEALQLAEQTLALYHAHVGPDHPGTLNAMSNLAIFYQNLGRHPDALKLRQELLAITKAKLGPDDPATLNRIESVAQSLINCDRGAEAIPLIDDCVSRAARQEASAKLIPALIDLRLRHFTKANDASGCRATAEMFESLGRRDPVSLYNAACYRAVTAAILRAADTSADGASRRAGTAEADGAMQWLSKAAAAGYTDVASIKQDQALEILRERRDFQELLAGLEARQVPAPVPATGRSNESF